MFEILKTDQAPAKGTQRRLFGYVSVHRKKSVSSVFSNLFRKNLPYIKPFLSIWWGEEPFFSHLLPKFLRNPHFLSENPNSDFFIFTSIIPWFKSVSLLILRFHLEIEDYFEPPFTACWFFMFSLDFAFDLGLWSGFAVKWKQRLARWWNAFNQSDVASSGGGLV